MPTASAADPQGIWPLSPDVAHLNHGSFGVTPRPVLEAQQRLRARIDTDRDRFFRRELVSALGKARDAAAHFCGAEPEGFALVANTSTGITAVLRSLALRPDDEVLVTDHGYVSARAAVDDVARRAGATVVEAHVPLDADRAGTVTAVVERLSPHTRLAVVDHVTSPTAIVLPVAALVTALHRAGVRVLVDAAHSPGMLPVDIAGSGADYWIGNFHKWALAPLSAAGLYVAPDHRAAMVPPVIATDHALGFPASFLRQGTLDYSALLCVPDGLRVHQDLGGQALCDRNHQLATAAQGIVAGALGTAAEVPTHPIGSMALVPLPEGVVTSAEAAVRMAEWIEDCLQAQVAVTYWQGRGYLRLSAHAYNTEEEYARLATGLSKHNGTLRRQ